MKQIFTCKAAIVFLVLFSLVSSRQNVHAQIIQYTNDTGGVLSMVATHVHADTLKRVNNATRLSTPCTHGFSTRGFTNATSYVDTLEAVQITFWPDTGYMIRVDSFVADLRYSPTGPSTARYAYSLNGGTTWIDQGIDQDPNLSGTCDSMVTCRWHPSSAIHVVYPGKCMFRVYGFNASVTTGTGNLQLLNLVVNGLVPSTMGVQSGLNESYVEIFPNPTAGDVMVSYDLISEDNVMLSACNMLGQQVASVPCAREAIGHYQHQLPVSIPGVYLVRLTVGDRTVTKRVVRL